MFCDSKANQIQAIPSTTSSKTSFTEWKTFGNYRNRHQKDLPLHSLTADDDPDTLKLQDVVDNHQVDAEKLRTLTDKGFAKIHLSDSQLLAVRMAMNENRPLVCIKGPPGTGKTFTLAHLIFRVLRSKMQAIVLTSTKEALQNLKEMTEKLLKERERELQVHEHAVMDLNTYLSLIDASEEAKVSVDQVGSLQKDAQFGETAHENYPEYCRRLEKAFCDEAGKEILKNVKVVFSTIESSFVDVVMQVESFKPFMCVIDEASQVLESQKWPTALKEKKLVLAGDPKQLPPFVKTQRERDMQPNQSVMERLWLKKEKYSWVMLSTQYRSVEEITDWSNSCFYDCRLKSCTKDLRRLVDDLNPKPEKSCFKLYSPMVHIDTSAVKEDPERVSTYEQRVIVVVDGEYEYSYSNKGEATYAMQHYKKLIDMGVQPERVAFLTPYRGQVILLGGMMEDLCKKYGNMDCKNTKIGTVDSVQGKEFDVVIFSSVRNNPQKNFGFVSEIRRLNVAVSRAKRHFALIGSGYMLTHNHSREVRRLFETIRNRFHPAILTGDLKKNVDYPPRNNFGLNFENFMRHSNDTKMIAWCEEFHKRGRDGL
ncbi:hypothetical protein B9Z55_024826 [Caenorhabditis nigoni]|uniref:Helicase ATP-binding domain-containing protein n=1 Tax=Caenorhabditis nigoni TaxID=1611254 RepID=A0A2G5SWK1_9PELO|nr:hypothetical protein B9Z55_024826 [Caenorhabditis nigoni]